MIKAKVNTGVVQRFLAQRCLSQNELAKRVGVSSGYMSQLLSGTRHPSPALRKRVLRALQPARFDDVFTLLGQGDPTEQQE